ncbi:hypothetical protein M422DRAFT_179856, partial [Sphaerobolus stellatus SS14]
RTNTTPRTGRVVCPRNTIKSIIALYKLEAEDILLTTPRYWEFHTDPISVMDCSAGTLLTIHYNLCCGTFARCSASRSELAKILEKMLSFQMMGQFCLTELGHGLDVMNLETTATLLPDGSFLLNTPVMRAAKYMPPTAPCGIPCIAVVFARLIVHREDRSIKPFAVPLHDGYTMAKGVTVKVLSPRGASRPLEHSLTYFTNVRLHLEALMDTMDKLENVRQGFFQQISRVVAGTLSMGVSALAPMKIGCFITARYSQRRMVTDASTGKLRPIISFRTQHAPILTVLAHIYVMEAFSKKCITLFSDNSIDFGLRHCITAVGKIGLLGHCQESLISLSERCGAQGLFEVNQLSVLHADMRGASIAEGDLLVLAIRFAMELLIGRIEFPEPNDPSGFLAQRELSMIDELRQLSTDTPPMTPIRYIGTQQSALAY